MKKILYCYWMQYNDTNNRGGGIQIYLKNVITKLNAVKGIKIYTLSSGVAYNFRESCRIEKSRIILMLNSTKSLTHQCLLHQSGHFISKIFILMIKVLRILLGNF